MRDEVLNYESSEARLSTGETGISRTATNEEPPGTLMTAAVEQSRSQIVSASPHQLCKTPIQ